MSHTLPVFQSAAVSADGLKVILSYGNMGSDPDQLSSTTAPPSAFDVRVNGTSASINSVTAGGTTVELTLVTAIESGESVSLDYTKPNDAYAIQNYNYGEDAANLSNVSVTNNSTVVASSPSEAPASAAPVFQSASTSTDGTIVILSYDQTLDSVDTPQTSAFDVQVNGTNIDVSYVSIYGSDVELTLATAIQSGEPVTVSYADPTSGDDINAIQSFADGTDAASLVSQAVTNAVTASTSTAPAFQSATTSTDGTKVILSYDQALSSDTAPLSAFDLEVNGTSATINSVSINGSSVELTLSTAIPSGDYVRVSYADPTGGDDANAIQSLSDGTDASTVGYEYVTNLSTFVPPPVFQSASTSADGTRVTLSYDKTLDSVNTAPLSAFDLQVNGTSATINSVSINGSSVELTLATAIKETQTVSLDYNDPTVGDDLYAVQEVNSGSDAASLSGISVTNTSTVDGTAPSFISLGLPWPSSVAQVGGYNGSPPGFDLYVTDAGSALALIELTFASPDGTDEVTINIDPDQASHGTNNTPGQNVGYRRMLDIPESALPGNIQGGRWTVKTLRLKDSFDNERIYTQAELPNAGFWVNNEPTRLQSITGKKEIGETLTINPDAIADPDIDNLPAGSFSPSYSYRWQISDDGAGGWQDISSQASYTLTEADVNKYFRSIVGYRQEDGVINESLASDPFKFTEYRSSDVPDVETFDDDLHGWTYLGGASVSRESAWSQNNYLGHLDYADQVTKTFNLQGSAYKVGLDFLKFNSWDTKYHHVPDGDTFSVQIDGQVLFTYRPNGDEYVSRPGDAAGYSWSLDRSTAGLSNGGVRYGIEIDLPIPLKDFTLQVNLDIDQPYTDEWGGIDNVRIYQETPISGPVAAPIFSSLDSATTVEKSGEGNIVYQAVADDQSPFTFSLEAADQNLFSIDSNTGVVRLLEEADFDRRQNYNFTVRATDAFGNYSDKAISLAVEDSSLAFWKDGGYRVDSAALKDALPSSNAIVLKDRYNRVLSDQISRSWDGVSVIKSNDGYRMLQVGERGRRRGKYRIAEINVDGVLQSVGSWVDKDQAVADRYQELFELDLNNDGQSALPAAVDVDLDGFVDGLGHYRLMGNGNAVDLNDERGNTLSAKTSRRWNAVVSKQIGSGFQVVIQGERGRQRSQYQIWTTDANGRLTDKTSWLDGSVLANQGYEQMFNRDFNNDRSVELSAVSQFSDANSDGFVDGLGHYMLMGLSLSNTVDFKDNRGRRLSSKSSRSWNALSATPNSDDPSSGFEVLIQGERGRRRSQYQVWSTNANGQLTSKTPWMDGKSLAQQGYETTFAKDFNGDELIGVPSGSALLDQDNNGLIDGITHYALLNGSGGTVQAIDLKDSRGRVLSDSSSRSWNIIHAVDDGNGFDVLVQGERGRRRSQYRLWRADQTGLITDRSRWLTGDQLASDGYESIFGLDLNNDGTIGL